MQKSKANLDGLYLFDDLLKGLNRTIIDHKGQQIEVANGMGECFSKKKDSVIRSWLWDVPGFRRWRVTRMDAGNKLQVLNSVAYPEYKNDQPILGIDLLWFGVKHKLVAVLDFQPLIQNDEYFLKYYKGLESLKASFPIFNNKSTKNIYDLNKYFSPWVLFYSGDVDSIEDSLTNIFYDFLQHYWQINQTAYPMSFALNPSKVKELHVGYDLYNSERDPAHGLFKSYFGQEWADEFVNNFLFPYSS